MRVHIQKFSRLYPNPHPFATGISWCAPSSVRSEKQAYGLQITCGGQFGSGVPSAFRLTGLESAPASRSAPANNSSTFFTVEHLSGWFWWFDRANVGAQSGLAAPGLKRSAVLKSKKIMTLKSALEDFSETTLAAIAGSLGRFAYVARLRESVGEPYTHWGLRRVYGEQAAQQAIAEAHRKLFLQLLRTPLRSLMTDLQISAEYSEGSLTEYVERLRSRCGALLPAELGGGSARHFNSVLHALALLASAPTQTPPDANRRA